MLKAEEFWIRKGSGSLPRTARKTTKKEKNKTVKRTELKKAVKSSNDASEGSNTKAPITANSADKTKSAASPAESTVVSPPGAHADRSADGEAYVPTFGRPQSRGFRVGVVIKTGRQPIKDVLAHIPVPQEWPEQEVGIFKDEVPGNFEVQEVEQLQGLQRLVLHGRSIESKQTVVALMTYKVTTKVINQPSDTSIFRLPDHKDKAVKGFLMTSEGINFRNKKLRKQAEELASSADSDWGKAQAIYDWVRDNIEQLPEVANARYLGAQAAFVKGEGFSDDVVSLFIAMCRSVRIPARTVYYDTGSYAEFMLDDGAGNHHWFPCDLVGLPAFGKTVEPKLILQKGDSIKVPGEKGRRKFVPATGICKGISGTVSPKAMNFVREPRPLGGN
jgi:transglutaminase-like putative cysteine protease